MPPYQITKRGSTWMAKKQHGRFCSCEFYRSSCFLHDKATKGGLNCTSEEFLIHLNTSIDILLGKEEFIKDLTWENDSAKCTNCTSKSFKDLDLQKSLLVVLSSLSYWLSCDNTGINASFNSNSYVFAKIILNEDKSTLHKLLKLLSHGDRIIAYKTRKLILLIFSNLKAFDHVRKKLTDKIISVLKNDYPISIGLNHGWKNLLLELLQILKADSKLQESDLTTEYYQVVFTVLDVSCQVFTHTTMCNNQPSSELETRTAFKTEETTLLEACLTTYLSIYQFMKSQDSNLFNPKILTDSIFYVLSNIGSLSSFPRTDQTSIIKIALKSLSNENAVLSDKQKDIVVWKIMEDYKLFLCKDFVLNAVKQSPTLFNNCVDTQNTMAPNSCRKLIKLLLICFENLLSDISMDVKDVFNHLAPFISWVSKCSNTVDEVDQIERFRIGLVSILIENDKDLIDASMFIIRIDQKLRLCRSNDDLVECFNCHQLFHQFLKSTGFNLDLLLDWLISPDTSFLLLLISYLKDSLNTPEYFRESFKAKKSIVEARNTLVDYDLSDEECDVQNEDLIFDKKGEEIINVFALLNNKLSVLNKRNLFPYNSKPLIKLLDKFVLIENLEI